MKYIFCGSSKNKSLSTINLKPTDTFYHIPLTEIRQVPAQFPKKQKYEAAVCCSQNIIQSIPNISHLNVQNWFAVGPQTALLMKRIWKLSQVYIPKQYNSLSVASKLLEHIQSGHVLWLGARGGVSSGVDKLTSLGLNVTLYQPYESHPVSIQRSAHIWEDKQLRMDTFIDENSIWIFTSPSTAKNYLDQNLYRNTHLLCCLGATTASIFLDRNITPYYVSKRSTIQFLVKGMLDKLEHQT